MGKETNSFMACESMKKTPKQKRAFRHFSKTLATTILLSSSLLLGGCEDLFTIEIGEVVANPPVEQPNEEGNKGLPSNGDSPINETPPTNDMPVEEPIEKVIPTLSFANSVTMVNESASQATIELFIDQAIDEDISVGIVAFGQALSGEDYQLANPAVTISAGSMSSDLVVNIINDTDAEGTESLQIGLNKPSNANLGMQISHTLSIMDDDMDDMPSMPDMPGGTPPISDDPDSISIQAFANSLLPVLREECSDCHVPAGPGRPDFAQMDAALSHEIILANQKVDLANPMGSRVVEKLQTENHFCARDVCDQRAEALLSGIMNWSAALADLIPDVDKPSESGIVSSLLRMGDGEIDDSKKRVQDSVIAFYEFKEGTGDIARDTSGVAPAMDLTLSGMEWIGGQGITNISGKAQADQQSSNKLFDLIAGQDGSQQYTIEAWVTPANTDQEGPARIVSYSNGTQQRNFTMGQAIYSYDFRNRNDGGEVGGNGTPSLRTDNNDMDLQATLQHVVFTYTEQDGRKVYVNGADTGDEDPATAGSLTNWNANYTFVLGNEITDNRLWQGQIFMVAVHNRALNTNEVAQNFDAGIGPRIVLNFDISMHVDTPNTFIQLEGRELDGYAYQFAEPTIISPMDINFPVAGMQIAVNNNVPNVGQSFKNLSVMATASGQLLSPLGAVIKKDLGVEQDQFSLHFEQLGNNTNVSVEPVFNRSPISQESLEFNNVGLRTFSQINATMAAVTGVDSTENAIRETFGTLKEQLPATADINTFVSAHQVGISKLALEYCNLLVEDNQYRNDFFSGLNIDLNSPPATVIGDNTSKMLLANYITEKVVGSGFESQPSVMDIQTDLVNMMTELTAGCENANQCDAQRTHTVVKATCSALIGSAVMLIQ